MVLIMELTKGNTRSLDHSSNQVVVPGLTHSPLAWKTAGHEADHSMVQ